MIIATAGHVDHGKTALVRALTGVETDTLAEEIERGLSINLGYAYLAKGQAPSAGPDTSPSANVLGFIDVPGHRRFINTMISGIGGIDMGLLVVAADDGPMPQTLEHIDVLAILGVQRLVVVISKVDRVDASQIDTVRQQLDGLLLRQRWPAPPVFEVSSQSGQGLERLKSYLLSAAMDAAKPRCSGHFRLSIDRSFIVSGVGLVVTGTASAGRIGLGDRLKLLPLGREVRVRHLRANNQEVESATAGQRVALGLAGKISLAEISRGDWLVAPGSLDPTTRIDAQITVLASAPFALKHMAPVKLYLGAKRLAARVAIVSGAEGAIGAGASCLVQLLLEAPVSTVWGELFLIRDQGETLILGGGRVLDPEGPKFGKSRADRLDWLGAQQIPGPEEALKNLLERGRAVDLTRFWAIRNRSSMPDRFPLPAGTRVFQRDGRQWAIGETRWAAIERWLEGFVADWHESNAELPGVTVSVLEAHMGSAFELNLGRAVVEAQLRTGYLALRDGHISRKNFVPAKSKEALEHWSALRGQLQQHHGTLPLLSDLLAQTGLPAHAAQEAFHIALGRGELHQLNDHRYALPEQLLHYYQRLVAAVEAGEALSVGNLKKRFATGRNLTVEILEYFDRLRLTRREGNVRVLLKRDNVAQRLGAEP